MDRTITLRFASSFRSLGPGRSCWLGGRAVATAGRRRGVRRFSALRGHYGVYVALWAVIPALCFLLVWASVSPALVTDQVLHDPAAQALPQFDFARASILSEARHIARGDIAAGFNPLSTRLAPAYAAAQSRFDWIGTTLALILAFAEIGRAHG